MSPVATPLSPRRQGIRRELRRRLLFPCRGYWSSKSKDILPPGVITGASTADSYNWLVSSQEGQLIRRRGIAYYQESDPTAQVGLLEAVSKNLSMNMTCRQLLDVQYPSSAPGTISGPTALYTDQTDAKHFGQVYALTATQGTRKVLGHEMGTLASPGTTHYPRSTANTKPNFRMMPLPYMAGGSGLSGVGYNRCTHPLLRALLCGGSMKLVQFGDDVFSPSLHGTPWKWNRKMNPSTSSGSEAVVIRPWGKITPLCRMAISANASGGTNDKVWWDGDQFYISVAYQFEDGSFSAPMQVRPVNSILGSGFGLVTVGSGSGTSAYRSLTLKNIPLGPPGTVARILLRTRKTNVSTATTRPDGMTQKGATSDIDAGGRKLFYFAKIANNLASTYEMVESNDDASLQDRPEITGEFYTWPLPARYAGEAEHRAVIGYTRKQNPCAIFLAPVATDETVSGLNCDDEGRQAGIEISTSTTGTGNTQPYGATAYCWLLLRQGATRTLLLRRSTIGTATIVVDATITITATLTIQDLIDTINNTAAASGVAWTAQPVPGTDTNQLARNLAESLHVNTGTFNADGTITYGGSHYIAVGMRVSGGSIPANSVVIDKSSDNTTFTVGTENGVQATLTPGSSGFKAWSDTGDDSWSTDTATWDNGNIRSYSSAFPSVIAHGSFYLNSLSLDKGALMFTTASPGTGKLSPENFQNVPGNRLRAPLDAGIYMGTARIEQGNIAFFSEGVFALKNKRDVNTGKDDDYYLYRLTGRDEGCTQYGTIINARGWAGCLTRSGFLVTDGSQYEIISPALFDSARGTGILGYQALSLMSVSGSADLPASQKAHAYVRDGQLWLTIQPNADISSQGGFGSQELLTASAAGGGDWSNVGGAGSMNAAISDSNDATYARWSDDGVSSTALAGDFASLSTLTDPGVDTGWKLRFHARSSLIATGATMHVTIRKQSGGTVVKEFVIGFNGNTFTPVDQQVALAFPSATNDYEIAFSAADGAIFDFAQAPTFNILFSGSHTLSATFDVSRMSIALANLPNVSMTDRGEFATFVYDFSAGIEEFGLAQIVGPPGNFPWSTPLITNTGAMVRTWDGSFYAANDSNTGSTANGAIYQLDTGLLDTPVKVLAYTSGIATIAGSLNSSTGVITATTATDFFRVAVGAKVTGSGITGVATVTAKSSDGNSITVTGTLTGNTSNVAYSCWGREIEAKAFMIADRGDLIGDSLSGQWMDVAYACPTGELFRMLHSYDLSRATSGSMDLGATGAANSTTHRAPQNRVLVPLPSDHRTGAQVQEWAILAYNGSAGSDSQARSEFWGGDAQYRVRRLYKGV